MSRSAGESPDTVRVERTFDRPAQHVFEAWTTVDVLKRWWHAEHGWETPSAELDLRLGGAIRVTMRNPEDGTEYAGGGEYTVIDPPRRLAFTWTWYDDPEGARQLIEVEFIGHGDRTTVVLTNSGLPEGETDDYRDGWNSSFDNLEAALRR
jgi:uncharacterized protein YndB with AHSA1/START domain